MSSAYGLISTHSLSICFPNYTQKDLSDLFNRHSSEGKLAIKDWNKLQEIERTMFLTDKHEFDHFYQLISSSLGLSLFRIHNALAGDIVWLSREFHKLDLNISNTGQDLVTWLREKGLDRFKSRSSLLPSGLEKAAHIEYEIIPGIDALRKLISLKTSRTLPKEFVDLTVGQLCDILNQSTRYLRKRSDINIGNNWEDTGFKWESNLDSKTKVFTGEIPFLSFSNLLEVLAYLDEYRFAQCNNANDKTLSNWFAERIPNSYKNAFGFFLKLFDNPSKARGFISTYLDSRIDIACGKENSNSQEVFYVEDEWPFFFNMLDQDGYNRKMINSIDSCNNILERKKLFGNESRWRELSANTQWNHLEFNSHLLKIEANFLKGIERKRDVIQHQINGLMTTIKLDDLIFSIEYKDRVKIWRDIDYSKPGAITSELNNLCSAMLHPLIPTIALRILEGKPVFMPNEKVDKILVTLKSNLGDYFGYDDLRQSLDKLFDKAIIEKEFPGIRIKWFHPLK